MLEVLEAGPLDTIQDAGRPDFAHLGVPRGGACDRRSLAAANALLGNRLDAPALEMSLAGPRLAVLETCVAAITGAELGARVVEEDRPLPVGSSALLRRGTTLAFEGAGPGARGYLALPGGIAAPLVLGSASTCLAGAFGGIDGRPLRAGDRLLPAGPVDVLRAGRSWPDRAPLPVEPVAIVRVVPGPHAGETGGPAPWEREWAVTDRVDRTGLRLHPVTPADGRRDHPREPLSMPMVTGALQSPPDGEAIVLLPDHGTVGGYLVSAVVITADLPLAAQLRPGLRVAFRLVTADAARTALIAAERAFRDSLVELATQATENEG